MERNDTLFCNCCGRPLRKVGTPCYNFPDAGIFCLDCAAKVAKHNKIKESNVRLYQYAYQYKNFIKDYKANIEVKYDSSNLRPFSVTSMIGSSGIVLDFYNLNDLKELRDKLNKFIDECEV